ncbi:DUF3995 domain-containing protein [Pseudomonas leptonychotis]|uniref:DUF3995 domain-containing protein n=1 Tax=Pseudomonas leptonychotis TaxID=2448482 RepID=UPI0039EFD251
MITIACIIILTYAAAFHFYWGFGGQLGISISVPQNEDGQPAFTKTAIGAHLVGLVLMSVVFLILAFTGYVNSPAPQEYLKFVVGTLSFAFTARAFSWHKYVGFFKSIRKTKFGKYDTWQYSPLCLLLGLGLFYVCVKT